MPMRYVEYLWLAAAMVLLAAFVIHYEGLGTTDRIIVLAMIALATALYAARARRRKLLDRRNRAHRDNGQH